MQSLVDRFYPELTAAGAMFTMFKTNSTATEAYNNVLYATIDETISTVSLIGSSQ